jgi:hypothetical protein
MHSIQLLTPDRFKSHAIFLVLFVLAKMPLIERQWPSLMMERWMENDIQRGRHDFVPTQLPEFPTRTFGMLSFSTTR